MSNRLLPLVYVAGPITQGDQAANVRRAVLVGRDLRATGRLLPLVPHFDHLMALIAPLDYEEYMAYDMALIRHVHALYRLHGASPGADREVAHARALGIPVFCEAPPDAPHNFAWADLMDFCGEWIAAHNSKETA